MLFQVCISFLGPFLQGSGEGRKSLTSLRIVWLQLHLLRAADWAITSTVFQDQTQLPWIDRSWLSEQVDLYLDGEKGPLVAILSFGFWVMVELSSLQLETEGQFLIGCWARASLSVPQGHPHSFSLGSLHLETPTVCQALRILPVSLMISSVLVPKGENSAFKGFYVIRSGSPE